MMTRMMTNNDDDDDDPKRQGRSDGVLIMLRM